MPVRGLLPAVLLLALGCAPEARQPYGSDYEELNGLTRDIVRSNHAADRARFADILSGHGMGAFDSTTVEWMEGRFRRIAPAIAESQAPPFRPRDDVQTWFRARARSADDRRIMIAALRRWLTEPVAAVAQHGSQKIEIAPADERIRVVEARIAAASFLAAWNAREALPEIRSLRDTLETLPAASSWLLPGWTEEIGENTLEAAEHRLESGSRVP